jgi:hypothetical protein
VGTVGWGGNALKTGETGDPICAFGSEGVVGVAGRGVRRGVALVAVFDGGSR